MTRLATLITVLLHPYGIREIRSFLRFLEGPCWAEDAYLIVRLVKVRLRVREEQISNSAEIPKQHLYKIPSKFKSVFNDIYLYVWNLFGLGRSSLLSRDMNL